MSPYYIEKFTFEHGDLIVTIRDSNDGSEDWSRTVRITANTIANGRPGIDVSSGD